MNPQLRQVKPLSTNDPVVEIVRRWPALSGEAQWAWVFLWELAGHRAGTLTVNPAAVAERQGKTDTASGKRSLRRLEGQGLIQILRDRGGSWQVYLEDPREINAARLRRVSADDAQPSMFPDDTEQPPIEDAASVPFQDADGQLHPGPTSEAFGGSAAHPPPNGASAAQAPSPMSSMSSTSNIELRAPITSSSDMGGSGSAAQAPIRQETSLQRRARLKAEQDQATKAAQEPVAGIDTIQVLDHLERIRANKEQEAQAIIALIDGVVRDLKLSREKKELIVEAIFSGRYTKRKLALILEELPAKVEELARRDPNGFGRKSPAEQRGSFFNGVMRRQFEEVGLEYSRRKPSLADDHGRPASSDAAENIPL